MPLSDIINREYGGIKPPADALCELCYIANVETSLFERLSRSQYKHQLNKLHVASQLSGRMVWSGGYVLHLLEGMFATIETRYGELRNDEVHVNVCHLLLQPIHQRRFDDWTLYSVDMHDIRNTELRIQALASMCKNNRQLGGVRALEIFLNPDEGVV
jgi:hypothetical protein